MYSRLDRSLYENHRLLYVYIKFEKLLNAHFATVLIFSSFQLNFEPKTDFTVIDVNKRIQPISMIIGLRIDCQWLLLSSVSVRTGRQGRQLRLLNRSRFIKLIMKKLSFPKFKILSTAKKVIDSTMMFFFTILSGRIHDKDPIMCSDFC